MRRRPGLDFMLQVLEARIGELEDLQPERTAELRADIGILRGYGGLPAFVRPLHLLAGVFADIAELESERFEARRTFARPARDYSTDELEATVQEHGSVREAARELGIAHTTIARRLRARGAKLHHQIRAPDTTASRTHQSSERGQ